MIKLIVFDLDGVLINTSKYHWESFNLALKQYGEHYLIDESQYQRFDGLTSKEKLLILTKEKGLNPIFYDDVLKAKTKLLNSAIKNKKIEFGNALDVVYNLKNKNYKIYVASNASNEFVYEILEKIHLIKAIDKVFTRDNCKNTKPHPEIYLRCMVEAGVAPKETLILEDSIVGKTAAIDSGGWLLPIKNMYQDVAVDNILNYIKFIDQK